MPRSLVVFVPLLAALALACAGEAEPPPDPGLTTEQISKLVRKDVKDKTSWAHDVRDALRASGQVPDEDHACQVLAVIEQESGYAADPAVPGLAELVERELAAAVDEKLGFLGPTALETILDVAPEGQKSTFRERLREVKTERDVDRLFREIVAHHEAKAPLVGKALRLVAPKLEERLNPVGTSGSMQVSVAYAQEAAAEDGLDAATVRELLYTQRGGVLYGTRRLFEHDAPYDKAIYRYADYNAGLYTSRNAALQSQLADLIEQPVAPDGDLLIWTDRGKPSNTDGATLKALLIWRTLYAPDMTEAQLRADARLEKTADFEETELWLRLKASWRERKGKDPAYAQLPDVALNSPKLKKDRTTKWFAESVERRYNDCRKRNG
jgi:hypothetical protein